MSSWLFAGRALSRVAGPRVLDAKAFFSPRDDFIPYTSQESGRPEVTSPRFPSIGRRGRLQPYLPRPEAVEGWSVKVSGASSTPTSTRSTWKIMRPPISVDSM